MFEKLIHEGPTNLPPSSQDGIIDVGRVHRNWQITFIFSRAGYSSVYGVYGVGKLALATNVVYYPPGQFEGQFFLDGELKSAVKNDGCFLVPMQR